MVNSWKIFRENNDAMALFDPIFSNFDLDGDPTETDPDEKPSREKKLIIEFKEPTSKLYSMFVQSVIPIFDSFVTFLQAE